jgi:hypothetical protein
MQLFFYAKSGHGIGLDAVRRCASIASLLQEFDPILCTSDFRAGAYAKEHLGIKKYVSVDVLSNLPNIMQRGDILIYDSDEASDFMEKQMKDFCSIVYKIGNEIPINVLHSTFFESKTNSTIKKALFFGDDDYNNLLLDICSGSSKQDLALLMGHYFFLGNESKFTPYFNSLLEEEEYIETIKTTQYLLSASINACLESLYCGNFPVFYKRDDKNYAHIQYIEKYNIPIIEAKSLDEMVNKFEYCIQNYPILNNFKTENIDFVHTDIENMTEKYNKLMTQ